MVPGDILSSIKTWYEIKRVDSKACMALAVVLWSVWCTRNKVIFEEKQVNMDEI